MKKFSVNLFKVGILVILCLCTFGVITKVEAATNIKQGKKTEILSLQKEEGIYGYSVKDSTGKEIENSTNLKGKCSYFKINLSGTSRLRWESKVFVNNEPKLNTELSVTVSEPGKYKLTVTKAKHVEGTWAAWKGDDVVYELIVEPTVEFKEKNINLKVGEKKDIEIMVSSANKYGIDPKSGSNSVAKVAMAPNSKKGKPVIRIEAIGDGNTNIEVTYTVNGIKATAKCTVNVEDNNEESLDETPTITFNFNEGDYLKYTAKTKTTWNLRTKGSDLYSTKGSVKKGKIAKDDIVKVTSIPETGMWVAVEVVTGDLKGAEGDLFFDSNAVKNFAKTTKPVEIVQPDDEEEIFDESEDEEVDDSTGTIDVNLEGLNGIMDLVKILVDTLLDIVTNFDWQGMASMAGELITVFTTAIGGLGN